MLLYDVRDAESDVPFRKTMIQILVVIIILISLADYLVDDRCWYYDHPYFTKGKN